MPMHETRPIINQHDIGHQLKIIQTQKKSWMHLANWVRKYSDFISSSFITIVSQMLQAKLGQIPNFYQKFVLQASLKQIMKYENFM